MMYIYVMFLYKSLLSLREMELNTGGVDENLAMFNRARYVDSMH